MYMYRGTSLFLSKIVASNGTSIEFVPIFEEISNKEAIGSSMETTCLRTWYLTQLLQNKEHLY